MMHGMRVSESKSVILNRDIFIQRGRRNKGRVFTFVHENEWWLDIEQQS